MKHLKDRPAERVTAPLTIAPIGARAKAGRASSDG